MSNSEQERLDAQHDKDNVMQSKVQICTGIGKQIILTFKEIDDELGDTVLYDTFHNESLSQDERLQVLTTTVERYVEHIKNTDDKGKKVLKQLINDEIENVYSIGKFSMILKQGDIKLLKRATLSVLVALAWIIGIIEIKPEINIIIGVITWIIEIRVICLIVDILIRILDIHRREI